MATDRQVEAARLAATLAERWPELQPVLRPRRLVAELGLSADRRSRLFRWLEPPHSANAVAFCSALAQALATLGVRRGTAERICRLQADDVGFWSALCELFLAASLERHGISVTLEADTPDLRCVTPNGPVGIELTAAFETLTFSQLVDAVGDAWEGPGRLTLLCPAETTRFLPRERDALLQRLRGFDAAGLARPGEAVDEPAGDEDSGYMYREEHFERGDLRVPTADLVEPERLEVFVDPSWSDVPYVGVRTSVRWGYVDPWPRILEQAHTKARKMPTGEPGMVAIEGGNVDASAHIWRGLLVAGKIRVGLSLRAHVAGVLVYWQDATAIDPRGATFIWNAAYEGPRPAIGHILQAASAVEVEANAEHDPAEQSDV